MNDEMREAFLEWAKLGSEPYDTAYTMNDIYLLCDTQHAWFGFQAAYQLQQARIDALAEVVMEECKTRDSLRAKLDIAIEALEDIDGLSFPAIHSANGLKKARMTARQTLAELKE